MGILNYEAYTIFSQKKEPLIPLENIHQADIDKLKGITVPDHPKYFGNAKGKNLIIIQLESFQNFLIGLKIDGKEITPNMNKLAKEQLYFSNFNQQVGQGNTSDAEFVVNTSFYIPPDGAATQRYVDKKLPSLPRLLEQNGYNTLTLHTNKVHFWNREELYSSLGFQHYYDQSYFGEDDLVFFGASDEVLYAKTAKKLQELDREDKPFTPKSSRCRRITRLRFRPENTKWNCLNVTKALLSETTSGRKIMPITLWGFSSTI